jgi:hypothetical protein
MTPGRKPGKEAIEVGRLTRPGKSDPGEPVAVRLLAKDGRRPQAVSAWSRRIARFLH